MPVSSQHPQYKSMIATWKMCRDAKGGERFVKAARTTYLPKLSDQSESDYNNYLLRATFFSITGKTLAALVGLATSKAPNLKYPPQLNDVFSDSSGAQFYEIFSKVLGETLLMGRIGILIDAPPDGGDAYVCTYAAEDIINWQLDANGKPVMVMLKETVYEADEDDAYELEEEVYYRELRLVDGIYTVTVIDEDESESEAFVPTVGGRPLNYIPFFIISPTGVHFDIDKPPMEDIASINMSHYRSSADLEWGRHFTGLPTPVVTGVDGNTVLTIGGTSAWILPDVQARAMYLEFTGQGLQSLEKALAEKQGQLASLSARMIDQSTRGSEAAETVRLRYLSESASLSEVVSSVEKGLNLSFKTLASFRKQNPDTVSITLPRDFLSSRMSGPDLTALTKSYLEEAITKDVYVYNLRKGDMLPPEKTDQEIINELPNIKRKEAATGKSAETV